MRHSGPTASARIGFVLLLIAITLVTPESAQLLVAACLGSLFAADAWRERRGLRRAAPVTGGSPPGRHRQRKELAAAAWSLPTTGR